MAPLTRRSLKDGASGGGAVDCRTDGRTDVETDEQIPPLFNRTLSPSGLMTENNYSDVNNCIRQKFVEGMDWGGSGRAGGSEFTVIISFFLNWHQNG